MQITSMCGRISTGKRRFNRDRGRPSFEWPGISQKRSRNLLLTFGRTACAEHSSIAMSTAVGLKFATSVYRLLDIDLVTGAPTRLAAASSWPKREAARGDAL